MTIWNLAELFYHRKLCLYKLLKTGNKVAIENVPIFIFVLKTPPKIFTFEKVGTWTLCCNTILPRLWSM